MTRYEEVVGFVETNHRNPSRHRFEERDMSNWMKVNRELCAGEKGRLISIVCLTNLT